MDCGGLGPTGSFPGHEDGGVCAGGGCRLMSMIFLDEHTVLCTYPL